MLYTGKGDDGTTKIYSCCDQRLSKSSKIAEALGALDEINSYLGYCRSQLDERNLTISLSRADEKIEMSFEKVLATIQQDLFIAQAEVAGADKKLSEGKTEFLEMVTNSAEKVLPPINSFVLPGGTAAAGLLDFARTIARRTERRVVDAKEEGMVELSGELLRYLNRLSSALYALARLANHKLGREEEKPTY